MLPTAPFDGRAGTFGDGIPVDGELVRSLRIRLAFCRPCSLTDDGAVGVAPMEVVGAEVGRIGNIPWKLSIDLPFLRSIPDIF